MNELILPAIVGIIVWLGYSIPDSYVTLAVTIFLIIALISATYMSGGLEGIIPAIVFVISVFFLIGLTISYYNKDSIETIENVSPLIIEDKKQKTNNSNLAETLKQLEEAGIITINGKK